MSKSLITVSTAKVGSHCITPFVLVLSDNELLGSKSMWHVSYSKATWERAATKSCSEPFASREKITTKEKRKWQRKDNNEREKITMKRIDLWLTPQETLQRRLYLRRQWTWQTWTLPRLLGRMTEEVHDAGGMVPSPETLHSGTEDQRHRHTPVPLFRNYQHPTTTELNNGFKTKSIIIHSSFYFF